MIGSIGLRFRPKSIFLAHVVKSLPPHPRCNDAHSLQRPPILWRNFLLWFNLSRCNVAQSRRERKASMHPLSFGLSALSENVAFRLDSCLGMADNTKEHSRAGAVTKPLITIDRPVPDRVRVTPGFVFHKRKGCGDEEPLGPYAFYGRRMTPRLRAEIRSYQVLSPSRCSPAAPTTISTS